MIHKLYINGKWISSTSKKTFPSYNPATNKIMGHFQAGNEKDVNKAVEAATKALPSWKATPAPKRAEYLFQIRDLLIKNKEDH
ncbi:aldehyde dehydrogenase, partial [archaeon]|nr:aldehyde dehydrogenase [archaeon]